MVTPMRRVLRVGLFASIAGVTALAGMVACSNASGNPDAGTGSSCPNVSTSCPATPPSWKNDVQPLIATYCLACHGDGGIEQSQFDYTTYQGVYKNRAAMVTQVYQCQMPPPDASLPAPPLTADQRETIVAWLACGAPNN
jgi:hypothetical protein